MAMQYLSQSSNKLIWNLIRSNPCCDHIVITERECDVLEEMFNINFTEHVPSDLIVSNTLPLKNLKITLTDNKGKTYESCVHIWGCPDQETFRKEKAVSVGALQISDTEFVQIDVEYGKNAIYHGYYGFKFEDSNSYLKAVRQHTKNRQQEYPEGLDFDTFVQRYTGMMMEVFYTVQVAMLHPITKLLFKKPALSVMRDTDKKAPSKKRRVTKYIKKYYIDPKQLEETVQQLSGQSRTYTCLAWYVCGHWRKYKNGSQVFIQPYWKGAMRNERAYVENLERTREIGQLKTACQEYEPRQTVAETAASYALPV